MWIDRIAASALTGVFSLICLFAGLTEPPRRAWWAAAPCTAILFATLNLPASVTAVRTVVAAGVLVAVSEIPAFLLQRVQAQEESLSALATTDPLTGLRNRRDLDAVVEMWSGRATVALLDIDFFKVFNDSHGHAAGDTLLRDFSSFLRGQCRQQDVLIRYGGEEFLVILTRTELAGAASAIARWASAWRASSPDLPTVSAGVATLVDASSVRLADQRLYEAKRAGRDRVIPPAQL